MEGGSKEEEAWVCDQEGEPRRPSLGTQGAKEGRQAVSRKDGTSSGRCLWVDSTNLIPGLQVIITGGGNSMGMRA